MGSDVQPKDESGEQRLAAQPSIPMREFLEQAPPGMRRSVLDFKSYEEKRAIINPVDVFLHCDTCNGARWYSSHSEAYIAPGQTALLAFVHYRCRNCAGVFKLFVLSAAVDGSEWSVIKLAELPDYGPPTPARLIRMLGKDAEEFLKGRRCEIQGFGIAAFAYYRRVVERRKNELFDEIIRVTKVVEPAFVDLLADLQAAKSQVQFTSAVESIKHGLPPSLTINGRNPLTLLHSALSEGVHEYSDQDCLDLAHSVRIVLIEFVDRLAQALRDDKEIAGAVKRLSDRKRTRPLSTSAHLD